MITGNSEPPLVVKTDLMIINITRMSIFFVSRLQSEQYLTDSSQEIIVARMKTFQTTLLRLLLPRNLIFLASRCSLKATCIYSAVSGKKQHRAYRCVLQAKCASHFKKSARYKFFYEYYSYLHILLEHIFSYCWPQKFSSPGWSDGNKMRPHTVKAFASHHISPWLRSPPLKGPTRLCS